jgi:multidrug resistance efflux pump
VVLAPVAGVLRLGSKDRRPVQIGDELERRELLCEIRPPEGMQVLSAVNERDLAGLAVGMPVEVRILALPGRRYAGRIASLGGAGRDKNSRLFEQGAAAAGVTVFDCRIALDGADADLRQGMSALVAIERARREECLWLPRHAVQVLATGPQVRRPDGRAVAVQGSFFGSEAFVLDGGRDASLAEGEQVLAYP